MIRAIAGIAVRSPTSSSHAASSGMANEPLGSRDRHRVADAVARRPLGDQPDVVHDDVEHQLAVRPRPHRVVAALELPGHDQPDPLVGTPVVEVNPRARPAEHVSRDEVRRAARVAGAASYWCLGCSSRRLRRPSVGRWDPSSVDEAGHQSGAAGTRRRRRRGAAPASTWWSWISLRSKASREPAM